MEGLTSVSQSMIKNKMLNFWGENQKKAGSQLIESLSMFCCSSTSDLCFQKLWFGFPSDCYFYKIEKQALLLIELRFVRLNLLDAHSAERSIKKKRTMESLEKLCQVR